MSLNPVLCAALLCLIAAACPLKHQQNDLRLVLAEADAAGVVPHNTSNVTKSYVMYCAAVLLLQRSH
jgi:hypothetical protein